MKKLFTLVFVAIATFNYANAAMMGTMDAGAINQQNIRDLRLHEAETRAKNKSAIIQKEKREGQTALKTVESASNIKNVVFVNNNAIPSSYLQAAIRDKINKPMTPENISEIRKSIMKYYQQNGYFSALAMVVSEDPQTGEVVFDIKEGGKNSIVIQN